MEIVYADETADYERKTTQNHLRVLEQVFLSVVMPHLLHILPHLLHISPPPSISPLFQRDAIYNTHSINTQFIMMNITTFLLIIHVLQQLHNAPPLQPNDDSSFAYIPLVHQLFFIPIANIDQTVYIHFKLIIF